MKRLSFRFVRRAFLILALLFPVMYMFGSFVAGLAGSHGNALFAQEDEVVTSSQIVDFNQFVRNGNFVDTSSWVAGNATFSVSDNVATITPNAVRSTFRQVISAVSGHKYFYNFDIKYTTGETYDYNIFGVGKFNNVGNGNWVNVYDVITAPAQVNNQINIYDYDVDVRSVWYLKYVFLIDLTQMFGVGNEPTADNFRSMYPDVYYEYTLSSPQVYETKEVPTYSEFVFNQILGSDNIIKQWGYYALTDGERGFQPFADLIQAMDENFLNFGTSNDLALFMYGYCYYALNVIAIYELVVLVVMVFTLPLKLTDRFTKEM